MPMIVVVWGPDEDCHHPQTGEPRRHVDIVPPDANALLMWQRGRDWHIAGMGRFEPIEPRHVKRLLKKLRL